MDSPAEAITPITGIVKLINKAIPAKICEIPVIFRCVSFRLKRKNSFFILSDNKQLKPQIKNDIAEKMIRIACSMFKLQIIDIIFLLI